MTTLPAEVVRRLKRISPTSGPHTSLVFARAKGFNDGDKRTALASALVFLVINGFSVHVPPVELYELTMSDAMGKGDDSSVAAYLRDTLVRSTGTGT